MTPEINDLIQREGLHLQLPDVHHHLSNLRMPPSRAECAFAMLREEVDRLANEAAGAGHDILVTMDAGRFLVFTVGLTEDSDFLRFRGEVGGLPAVALVHPGQLHVQVLVMPKIVPVGERRITGFWREPAQSGDGG
jgi:hypothetical protein